jgi:hypothetical protein
VGCGASATAGNFLFLEERLSSPALWSSPGLNSAEVVTSFRMVFAVEAVESLRLFASSVELSKAKS